jgi:hypothetical protein
MTSTRAKPIRRIPAPVRPRGSEGNRDSRHNPANLGATLRDVAVRAHRAVRALEAASHQGAGGTDVSEPLRELAELQPRIVQLQQDLDPKSQDGLASYLSALRREVENRLC